MKSNRLSLVSLGLLIVTLLLLAFSVPAAHAQTATLSATSHTFGSVAVSASSNTASVRLTNSGTAALANVSIAASTNFTEANTCGTSVAAGKNCTISITFVPTATGTLTGSVTITDSLGTQTISLSGTGAAPITISPASHAFGSVALGSTSAVETLTVTNKGTAAASLSIDSSSAAFPDANSCGTSLAGSSSCTVSVTFVPGTTSGHQTGTVSIGYTLDSVSGTVSAAVQGTGVEPISVSPSSRALGSVAIGQTSAAKTFTVTNESSSTESLTVTASAPFAESDTCSSVAAGKTCTITATYTPSTATPLVTGQQTGIITVADGTLDTVSLSLTGTAVAPVTVSPSSIAFSTTLAVGTASAAHTVTINNKESIPLTILSIVASPASYAVTATTCGSSLAASSSCTVTLVFTPAVSGSIPGTLTISDSAVGSPQVVSLTGGGQTNNLRSIAITVPDSSLPAGETEQATATGTYANGTTGNVTALATWTSSTADATVGSTTGLVTGVTPGTSTITATVVDTGGTTVTGSTMVTIGAKVVTALAVSAPSSSIYPFGTDQFTATATYSDGSTGTVAATFASSNTAAATITTAGLATGVLSAAGGTTNITATFSSITSPAFVLTVKGVQSVAVTPANPTFPLGLANSALAYGPTNNAVQFTATATYTDSTTANVTSTATWQSSATAVATINTAGLATVVTPAGTTTTTTSTISATYGAVGSTLLTVQPPILESIAVCLGGYPSPTCGTSTASVGVTLGLNATQQFSAVGTYSDNSTQNLTNIATWQAHDPVEVNVNSTGLATVLATDNNAHAVSASYGTIAAYQYSDTGWITASTTAPISCASPIIDMKLLVINTASASYADFPAIQQILNYVGIPYDVVDTSGAAPTLSDGACHGYYQGVIFAYGGDYYSIGSWQTALISYEQTFGVRQVNWYDAPDTNFGLSYTGTQINTSPTTAGGTGPYTTNFTAAAAPVFFYANTATPLSITYAAVDLATADPAAGGTLTPLLQDADGNIVSAIYNYDGQQFLSQTFDSNPYLMHDLIVAYGLVNWVTNGVFLGDYHVYATQSIDDFFINDSDWVPNTPCLTNLATKDRTLPDASNLPVFRVDSSDMTQLATWQKTKQADPLLNFSPTTQFELTIAMNGVGTTGNGDWTGLVAPIISSSAAGGIATFTAEYFSGLPGQTVTISGTTNGGEVLNGTWTILAVTASSGATSTTPGTDTFTATVTYSGTLASAPENGKLDQSGTATATITDDLVANLQSYQQYFHWMSHTYDHPETLNGLCQSTPNDLPTCGDSVDAPDYVDDIDLEILTNRWVASDPSAQSSWMLDTDTSDTVKQLTFTDFNPGNIVTPGVTGLNDPNVPMYLYNDGIRYAVSDTSVATTTDPANNNGPNPSPNVGIVNSYEPGIYEVPRHPNDVFYNVSNWANDQTEFDCIYTNYVSPTAPAGTAPAPDPPFNTYNAAEILDFTSSAFVTNMLMGDMDPEMFHQPDLHFSDNYNNLMNLANLTVNGADATIPPSVSSFLGTSGPHVSSLLSDTYDLTFIKYEAVYKLPVLTPTMDNLALLMQNRNSFNLSGVTASIIGAGTASAQITITVPSTASSAGVTTAVIPVTGLTSTGSESYGGQNISHITMTPGQTITFPLP
ncbi:MAG: choice-of-anchor D domain-containing protein [Candidatus Acidiferrum sp.]